MAYAWAVVVAGLAGTIATTCVMLFRGAGAANLGRPGAVRVAAIFGTVWTAWVLASASLASGGVYQFAPGKVEPWLALAMVVPLIALLLATRIPVVSRTLDQPNTQLWLTVAQIFRVEGAAFLIVMALGDLPAGFALPAGLGDIAIGFGAIAVARDLRRDNVNRKLVWFNILGLLDLVVATVLGVAAAPGLAHVLELSPSTAQIGLLPLVLIPTTLVPLAAALHIVSLRQLSAAAAATPDSILVGA
ncbi:hypothetical protein [Mycolicibacterium sp. NCC-Tsukiji]|uniref:hypothetical protein n=1 Tax=Mycolicibacterium sp. NCC-Tsukiji TaxID=2185272 RepID=UPI000EC70FC8|nr:hypothetical protein [Mycolicibacterium sp. NCC-Tsukiji]GCA98377.1 hypothetical protein NCCNTM_20120 [Mycolicibacterium sp. NCC-Tsukiji]